MGRKTPRQRGLFGGYMPPPRETRGRPAIAWSAEAAETVAVLAADDETQEKIAEAIGVSVKTLKRIYADELERGATLIRQAVLKGQVRKALEGNTPAARFVAAALVKGQAAEAAYAPTRSAEPRAPRLGKKEERQAAAEQVGGIFAPGAPPARLVN